MAVDDEPARRIVTGRESAATPKILLVDGDEAAAAQMRRRLRRLGYAVSGVLSCGAQAIEHAAAHRLDLVMIDVALAGAVDGVEAATVIARRRSLPVIFLVDAAAGELPPQAWDAAPYGCVLKGGDERQLRLNVETALRLHARQQQPHDELIETAFDSISDGMVATDTKGNFLYVNETAKRIVGVESEDAGPDEWSEAYGTFHLDRTTLYPPEELPLARAMRGERTDGVELFIRNRQRPQGVYISVTGRPLRDAAGTHVGGVIVLRDVTRDKDAERSLQRTMRDLREQNQLMNTVFDSISDGVVVVDERGTYLIFNPSAKRIVGFQEPDAPLDRRSEVYGLFRTDGTRFPSDELPLARALRGESTEQVQVIVRNRRRPYVHISVSGEPLSDTSVSGTRAAAVIVFRDVTEIKQYEQQLRDTAERLREQTETLNAVVDSIGDGVVASDETGSVTIMNPGAERIAGFMMPDAASDPSCPDDGIFYADRMTPVPPDELPLALALRGEESDDVELYVRNRRVPKGAYLSVNGRPLRDRSGRRRGGVITFRDVTGRLRAEEALAEAFAQGRLEMVDTILHNIGNAINSVAVGVETNRRRLRDRTLLRRLASLAQAAEAHRGDWLAYLRDDPQGRQVRPFIVALAADFAGHHAELEETLDRVGNRVAHIVDIVRTQRAFDRGRPMRKEIGLRASIDAAVKLMQDSLSARKVEVAVACTAEPDAIYVDESRFQQMLVNLIKNAMDAVDELARTGGADAAPRIRIAAYVQDEFLIVDVTDNGVGIDRKDFRKIFSAGYTTKEAGSGLGLHSSANFVIGSGGRILPLSDGVGRGATIRVMLRRSAVTPPRAAPSASGQPQAHR